LALAERVAWLAVIPAALQQRLPASLREGLMLRPITAADVRERSNGQVTRSIWWTSEPEFRRAGLFDAEIFGPGFEDPTPNVERERVDGNVDTFVAQVSNRFGHIDLPIPVPNPFAGHAMEAIAVLPPTLRPMIYLTNQRFSASNLNDLYQNVIETAARLRRLQQMDPEHAHRHAGELAIAVEQLFLNGSSDPARTPAGRPMTSLADHLRIVGRSGLKVLLWALGFEASWT
jgi:DNA-directed RNA polymerase beta' subunit